MQNNKPKYSSKDKQELLKVLRKSQGSWADDTDWDKRQKEWDALERKKAEELRKEVW